MPTGWIYGWAKLTLSCTTRYIASGISYIVLVPLVYTLRRHIYGIFSWFLLRSGRQKVFPWPSPQRRRFGELSLNVSYPFRSRFFCFLFVLACEVVFAHTSGPPLSPHIRRVRL